MAKYDAWALRCLSTKMLEYFISALHFMEPSSTGWRSDEWDGCDISCLHTLDGKSTLCLAALITDGLSQIAYHYFCSFHVEISQLFYSHPCSGLKHSFVFYWNTYMHMLNKAESFATRSYIQVIPLPKQLDQDQWQQYSFDSIPKPSVLIGFPII